MTTHRINLSDVDASTLTEQEYERLADRLVALRDVSTTISGYLVLSENPSGCGSVLGPVWDWGGESWICTLPPGHKGRHVCGQGAYVVEWEDGT